MRLIKTEQHRIYVLFTYSVVLIIQIHVYRYRNFLYLHTCIGIIRTIE